ncbi:MAG: class I SAM-dependent methyltransferase, partial [Steroidobacteraceae bacterium]
TEAVEIRVGRAIDTLPELVDVAPFDFIFIDADKESIPEYFTWALRLARPGTAIVVDNVIREGAVADAASTDPRVQGVRRFNSMLSSEPRVSATAVQTVGSKGYDGFALVMVVA